MFPLSIDEVKHPICTVVADSSCSVLLEAVSGSPLTAEAVVSSGSAVAVGTDFAGCSIVVEVGCSGTGRGGGVCGRQLRCIRKGGFHRRGLICAPENHPENSHCNDDESRRGSILFPAADSGEVLWLLHPVSGCFWGSEDRYFCGSFHIHEERLVISIKSQCIFPEKCDHIGRWEECKIARFKLFNLLGGNS